MTAAGTWYRYRLFIPINTTIYDFKNIALSSSATPCYHCTPDRFLAILLVTFHENSKEAFTLASIIMAHFTFMGLRREILNHLSGRNKTQSVMQQKANRRIPP